MIGTLSLMTTGACRLADIPGLIDGAHRAWAWATISLRHIERTRFLVFVIDMGATDGRIPADDFLHLREELRLYCAELDDRPYLVVANKMDAPGSDEYLAEFTRRTEVTPARALRRARRGRGFGPGAHPTAFLPLV